ncbi:MAG: phytanoyl-CoA dioxygenase family protein [Gammaproteobacteria bacterium]|nr:phytanoyl-CoA dioxygenase family protein [Gammaproteobacteria bacterium]
MLTRAWPGGYLLPLEDSTSPHSRELEEFGATLVKSAFSEDEIASLRSEIEHVYAKVPPDSRGANKSREIADEFRYEMFNRSPLSQEIVGRREILEVIEPLLGEDCHIIANTCWRNPPSDKSRHGGGSWHIDAGPHIPLAAGQVWPADIPHPTFAIGVHIYLEDCPVEAGPTAVIPGSHKSGRPPPREHHDDAELTFNGVGAQTFATHAGDVLFFVSDVWHRRMPPGREHDGRFFLQVHYARRDIAQRVKTTQDRNHIDEDAMSRIDSVRERLLFGLHGQSFYDG